MNKRQTIRVGLAGNPNCGKTTIFNALTGAHQKVGNYAGVTVEKKEGHLTYHDVQFIIYDLPGTYSLTAYSVDEVVARDFIIGEKPDVVIDVIDATSIERNLNLCLQFQELGIPVVGALNIIDQAEARGIRIDEKKLGAILGIPIAKTIGTKGTGLHELLDMVIARAKNPQTESRSISYGPELETEVARIVSIMEQDTQFARTYPVRWCALKLLEKDANALEKVGRHSRFGEIEKEVRAATSRIETHFGRDSAIVVTEQRYSYVHGAVMESVERVAETGFHLTEAIDRVLLNRYLGLPVFMLILWAIFQTTFILGGYPMGWLESFFSNISQFISTAMPDGLPKSLVIDGVIHGVGGVLSFVPLIVILFALLSFLEDSGYMARAAFISDKFLHIFGLHGQSFLPMVIGFGCSVPAVMAARTLKNPRDRIITILVTPFMTCGAKLPVHVLLAGAFFPAHAGSVVMGVYVLGVLFALLSSLLLRKTILKGEATPFVMELPPYRMPTVQGIAWHVWDKTWQYFKKAGTVILAAAILIWAITAFPRLGHDETSDKIEADAFRSTQATGLSPQESDRAVAVHLQTLHAKKALEHSIAGHIGKMVEPAVAPMGFDWRIGIAAITGFAAKEVVVSTLGVLYRVGTEETEESQNLRSALQKDPGFTPLVAVVLMLFTLIIAPCFAALAAIRAEIGSKWLWFNIGYTTIFAWIVCTAAYQIGRLMGLGS